MAAISDLNGNGKPDYTEGWFWRATWGAFAWGVKTFASPHTLVYRGVVAAEKARAEFQVPRTPTKP